MSIMKLGLTVSCGRDNLMNNKFKIVLSPELPGKKPQEVVLDFDDPPVSAHDVATKVADAINKAGGTASVKSQTQSTGPKSRTGGTGKATPTTTDVCLITISGLESMDIRSNDGKIRWFDVDGGGSSGVGLSAKHPTQITDIDCEKYRKKVAEVKEKEAKENAKRARMGKSSKKHRHPKPGTAVDWFCHPDWKWSQLAALGGMPPIGSLIVGTGDISEISLPHFNGDLLSLFMGPTWAVIPFRVVGRSLNLQNLEIRMRLASAGVVTSSRDDGVIEPLRFIEGRLDGQAVTSFGIATPYDPLGYGPFPWTTVVGNADAVAGHLRASAQHYGVTASQLMAFDGMSVRPAPQPSMLASFVAPGLAGPTEAPHTGRDLDAFYRASETTSPLALSPPQAEPWTYEPDARTPPVQEE